MSGCAATTRWPSCATIVCSPAAVCSRESDYSDAGRGRYRLVLDTAMKCHAVALALQQNSRARSRLSLDHAMVCKQCSEMPQMRHYTAQLSGNTGTAFARREGHVGGHAGPPAVSDRDNDYVISCPEGPSRRHRQEPPKCCRCTRPFAARQASTCPSLPASRQPRSQAPVRAT